MIRLVDSFHVPHVLDYSLDADETESSFESVVNDGYMQGFKAIKTEKISIDGDEEKHDFFISMVQVLRTSYQSVDQLLGKIKGHGSQLLERSGQLLDESLESGEVLFINAYVNSFEEIASDLSKLFLVHIISHCTVDIFLMAHIIELTETETGDIEANRFLSMNLLNEDRKISGYPLLEDQFDVFSERFNAATSIVFNILLEAIDVHNKYYNRVIWNHLREPLSAGGGVIEFTQEKSFLRISVSDEMTMTGDENEQTIQEVEAELFESETQIGRLHIVQKTIYDRLTDETREDGEYDEDDESTSEPSEIINTVELIYFEPKSELEFIITAEYSEIESDDDTTSVQIRYQGEDVQKILLDLGNGFVLSYDEVDPELATYMNEHNISMSIIIAQASKFLDQTLSQIESRSA